MTRRTSLGELIANAISHGVGFALSIAALIVLTTHANAGVERFGVAVFAVSMMVLYLSSTLFHAFPDSMKRTIAVFRRLDHSAIYLLIAGTYTPFIVLLAPGVSGWLLLGFLWTIAVVGIVLKSIWIRRYQAFHLFMYVLMGWSIIFIYGDVAHLMTGPTAQWLFLGGIAYTAGILFYINRFKYAHFVWHLFVLSGSAFHFISVLTIL